MMKITSTSNPRIKKVIKLKHRKNRDLSGLTLVDGVREILRARESQVVFEEIYICPEILKAHGQNTLLQDISTWNVPVFETSKEVLEKMSFGDRKEGVVALARPLLFALSQLKLKQNPLVVVVEGVEKPGNLGAILRTCDGAAVDALFVSDSKTDVFNPNVIRSSIGAVFSVPVVSGTNRQVMEYLREKQIFILAASPQGKQSYWNTDLKGPLALVLGSEQEGLSDFWINEADIQVCIPMKGKADSLNVSTTAAILMYEAIRQRR